MTFLEVGDAALVPNPGYPTYTSAVKLSGGEILPYVLEEKNNWHPDLKSWKKMIDEHHAKQKGRVKLLFLNYPHMPTGQLPDADLLKEIIAFAKQEELLIIHDNPYSFILNDSPSSLLSFDPEKEVVIELNSLSKSHNMAGWRVGMIIASGEHIEAILRFKSNMDSGMFLPVQLAAAKALALGQDWHEEVNAIYKERKELACQLLDLLNCTYAKDQVGMFVWAKIPDHCENGFVLSDKVLHNANVFITPGGIFGNAGDGFVRISLCSKKEVLAKAIERVQEMLENA
jgi:aspartate/methionine/tyrosine aminotransferase